MREILFRGKTYDGKWEQGDLRHGGYTHNDSETYIMRADIALHNIPVDPKTVGQYTGLTDTNGKKIFEGDVLHLSCPAEHFDWNAVVSFGQVDDEDEYTLGYRLDSLTEKSGTSLKVLLWIGCEDEGVYSEVIGNIYDNPEFLRGNVGGI